MSRVFGLWRGGSGYGLGDMFEDMESWPSRKAAKTALWRRAETGMWPCDDHAQRVEFDDEGFASLGEAVGAVAYPLVESGECSLEVFGSERQGQKWAVSGEPIERWTLGSRGGVRVESC